MITQAVEDGPRTASPPPIAFQRTVSDDIDKRAEAFIENFYKRIQMERQVSLELRAQFSVCMNELGSDQVLHTCRLGQQRFSQSLNWAMFRVKWEDGIFTAVLLSERSFTNGKSFLRKRMRKLLSFNISLS
ncbi:hypothetical protein H6P81_000454 [Aristolochia fimbriata]|uniref:Uncharacterized protein n=1 Tax=Aristolochia fimbriata TaxID=158543 RepID=A0AAV7F5D4_ARIFI|nr:hypothetical protein H6P81_000454 [Aristolochia fimbriata]